MAAQTEWPALQARVSNRLSRYFCTTPFNLRNARHADDPRPLDEESPWPSTSGTARAYLHHLVKSGETLGAMLLSEINVAYYQQLMHDIRDAISKGTFEDFRDRTRADWARGDIAPR